MKTKQTSERDWPEDFSHENGNYLCQCFECTRTFRGYKRRVVCKTCSESQLVNLTNEIEHHWDALTDFNEARG